MIPMAQSAVQQQSGKGLRPKLLVSVRNAAEAATAMAGGADWIDLKEPLAGPLGAVDIRAAHAVVETVAGRGHVSAALGELVDWPSSPARHLLDVPGISVVKLGLSGCALRSDWIDRWQEAASEVANAKKKLVAVVYADAELAQSPSPQEVVCQAIAGSFRYLLLDTYDKQAGSLLSHISSQTLTGILDQAAEANLLTVIAGGLLTTTLASLPDAWPGVVAVRGGVCAQARSSEVKQDLVEQFRTAIATRWPA